MSEFLRFLSGVGIGVVLVLVLAQGMDAYRSWRYHFRHMRELRERPKMPPTIHRLAIERHRTDGEYWTVYAQGRDGEEIDWNTGEHPMDAIRYLIEQHKGDARVA